MTTLTNFSRESCLYEQPTVSVTQRHASGKRHEFVPSSYTFRILIHMKHHCRIFFIPLNQFSSSSIHYLCLPKSSSTPLAGLKKHHWQGYIQRWRAGHHRPIVLPIGQKWNSSTLEMFLYPLAPSRYCLLNWSIDYLNEWISILNFLLLWILKFETHIVSKSILICQLVYSLECWYIDLHSSQLPRCQPVTKYI